VSSPIRLSVSGGPKLRVHELYEVVPGQCATVEFKSVVPQLGILQEMEHDISDPLVFWCAPNWGITFAMVEPGQRVNDADEFGEFQLVGSR
jgi:hypothetical protein